MSGYTPPNDVTGQQRTNERAGGYGRPGPSGQHEGPGPHSGHRGEPGGYEPQGRQAGVGRQGSTGQPEPVAEMAVSRPTLRWVSVTHPDRPVPVGDEDYVLDSYFDPQYGTWEALVLVQPTATGEDEEAEHEDE